ncbi:MAG: hypothetical protein AAB587_01680 [Patescibacteria group bacterium]
MISIDDFSKVEIKIGKILSAEKVPETDKLLRLSVDFGEGSPRQVISGIAEFVPAPSTLVGTCAPFVTNLEIRVIRELESQAMILAVKTESGGFSLISSSPDVVPGSKVS